MISQLWFCIKVCLFIIVFKKWPEPISDGQSRYFKVVSLTKPMVVRLSKNIITPNLLSRFTIFETKCTWCTSSPGKMINYFGCWSNLILLLYACYKFLDSADFNHFWTEIVPSFAAFKEWLEKYEILDGFVSECQASSLRDQFHNKHQVCYSSITDLQIWFPEVWGDWGNISCNLHPKWTFNSFSKFNVSTELASYLFRQLISLTPG